MNFGMFDRPVSMGGFPTPPTGLQPFPAGEPAFQGDVSAAHQLTNKLLGMDAHAPVSLDESFSAIYAALTEARA